MRRHPKKLHGDREVAVAYNRLIARLPSHMQAFVTVRRGEKRGLKIIVHGTVMGYFRNEKPIFTTHTRRRDFPSQTLINQILMLS